MASDEQDQAEALDDDELTERFPPEELLGANQYGVTVAEERVDEPLDERISREEPDVDESAIDDAAADDEFVDELADVELIDEDPLQDGELVAEARLDRRDVLDADDIASGDTTRRDVATERGARLAPEDAAVHLTDEE